MWGPGLVSTGPHFGAQGWWVMSKPGTSIHSERMEKGWMASAMSLPFKPARALLRCRKLTPDSLARIAAGARGRLVTKASMRRRISMDWRRCRACCSHHNVPLLLTVVAIVLTSERAPHEVQKL